MIHSMMNMKFANKAKDEPPGRQVNKFEQRVSLASISGRFAFHSLNMLFCSLSVSICSLFLFSQTLTHFFVRMNTLLCFFRAI